MKPEIAALFLERFPRYALALREWAPSPQKKAAPKLNNLPLESAQILYLYGLESKAALELLPWLSLDPKRRLIFLEPNTGEIASFLEEESAQEILLQKQIEIYHLPKRRRKSLLIDELSKRYSSKAVFVCYCKGNRQAFSRLKVELLRKTAVAFTFHVELLKSPVLLSNLKKNCASIPESFCVESLKGAFASIPAIICGAGPSLQNALGILRNLQQKALIIAGGSAITALSLQGIEPHLAVALDPNEEEFERLKNSCAFQTPFLFSLRLNSDSLAVSNGPLGFTRSTMSGTIPLWLEKEIGLSPPLIGQVLAPGSYSVTMISAAIAYHLGCNPILFDGIDLAYTENRRYAEGVEATETKELLQPYDRLLNKRAKSGAKVTSAIRWVMEADALSKLAKKNPDRRWIQCTANGLAIKHLESMPLADAAKLLTQEWDLGGIIHQAISSAPMPREALPLYLEKLKELESSLDRLLEHLDALVKNTPGLAILAELEMIEEPAYRLLFHNTARALPALFPDMKEKKDYWIAFQALVQSCKNALQI